MDSEDVERRRDGAAVLVALVAALVPLVAVGLHERLRRFAPTATIPVELLTLDLESVGARGTGPRDLRRLPGIGRVRALQIARIRWMRGGRFEVEDWSAVPGIGAVTRDGVREWLAGKP